MSVHEIHPNRAVAIRFEIVKPIENRVVSDTTVTEFDFEAIADEVIGKSKDGYARMVDEDRFWAIVASHYIGSRKPHIIWDEQPEGEEDVVHLMQWSDDEASFIEIDSETIEPSEESEPYEAAEKRLANRNGLELNDETVVFSW